MVVLSVAACDTVEPQPDPAPSSIQPIPRVDFATGLDVARTLAALPDGRVLVWDAVSRLSVFSAAGEREDFATGVSAKDTAVFPDGRLLVADRGRGLIWMLSITGEKSIFVNRNGTLEPTAMDNPTGVAILPDGRVLVAEYRRDRISVVSPSGVRSDFATGLLSPYDLEVLPDGGVLVIEDPQDGQSRISVLTASGERSDFAAGLGVFGFYSQMAVLPDGRVLVAEPSLDRVSVLSATGERSDFATGLERPQGLAVLPDGRVLVTEQGPSRGQGRISVIGDD
ncbi:hypothetical protein [Rubrivirga sp.]|uniref:hypothetical protein n=1 Tax=Rubrivirga sp. TaxID=1885344 RepID=UPI003B52D1BE